MTRTFIISTIVARGKVGIKASMAFVLPGPLVLAFAIPWSTPALAFIAPGATGPGVRPPGATGPGGHTPGATGPGVRTPQDHWSWCSPSWSNRSWCSSSWSHWTWATSRSRWSWPTCQSYWTRPTSPEPLVPANILGAAGPGQHSGAAGHGLTCQSHQYRGQHPWKPRGHGQASRSC